MSTRALIAAAPVLLLARCLIFADHADPWPCKTNGDCAADERCRVEAGGQRSVCVNAWTCRETQDCDPGLVCENGTCVAPVVCPVCGVREYCNASGQCEDACGSAECGALHDVNCGACPSGLSCDPAGKCTTQVCTPNATYCTGMSRIQCSSDGLSESELEHCGPEKCCAPDKCAPWICTPGDKFCAADDHYSTCAADGCGVLADATDCSALGAICNNSLGCTYIDVLGSGGTVVTNPCYESGSARQTTGVIIKVSKSVRLWKFQQSFYINGKPASMRWMVYEASSLSGQYNQIYSHTTSEPTTKPKTKITSPPINVQLTTGRYYLIGTECVDPWECWTFANDSVPSSKDPAFGAVKYNVYFGCGALGSSFPISQATPYSEVFDFTLWSTPL